ncbi:MAG: hypothetical protein NTZ33_03505 [Bacteroidetes bacterium]|nr:hypothetical protein [Bacteroidota bacterium]
MIIEDFKSGLILDIIIKNLNDAEIDKLEFSTKVKDNCKEQIRAEIGSNRTSDTIAWKNQWRDHIPD